MRKKATIVWDDGGDPVIENGISNCLDEFDSVAAYLRACVRAFEARETNDRYRKILDRLEQLDSKLDRLEYVTMPESKAKAKLNVDLLDKVLEQI